MDGSSTTRVVAGERRERTGRGRGAHPHPGTLGTGSPNNQAGGPRGAGLLALRAGDPRQAPSFATWRVSWDFLRAALFGWITRRLASLSSRAEVSLRSSCAAAGSVAWTTFLMDVLR